MVSNGVKLETLPYRNDKGARGTDEEAGQLVTVHIVVDLRVGIDEAAIAEAIKVKLVIKDFIVESVICMYEYEKRM